MTISDDEDVSLAEFLESEVLSEVSDQEEEEAAVEKAEEGEELKIKRARLGEKGKEKAPENDEEYCFNYNIINNNNNNNNNKIKNYNNNNYKMTRLAENGSLSKIPPEIFSHILKFLSSEDLIACSLVCRYLNSAASDESLWRRLYCMRWGLLPPSKKLSSEYAWKKLYIQRDEEDMVKIVRNCPPEFKEYYVQMQAAKRSQAPLPSQVKDDQTVLDKSVADQVSIWKSSRGLSDKVVTNHVCSGETCSYNQIGDSFICEKTGNVHVCDDTCREVIMDPANELLVCTISGRCFDRLLLPSETEADNDQQQGGVTDEVEPFMGSGRFARAYLLGYNCDDEKELEAALRFC